MLSVCLIFKQLSTQKFYCYISLLLAVISAIIIIQKQTFFKQHNENHYDKNRHFNHWRGSGGDVGRNLRLPFGSGFYHPGGGRAGGVDQSGKIDRKFPWFSGEKDRAGAG